MDQDTRWLTRYNEVIKFMEANKRNSSKHRIEEHDMLNWLKANRKRRPPLAGGWSVRGAE